MSSTTNANQLLNTINQAPIDIAKLKQELFESISKDFMNKRIKDDRESEIKQLASRIKYLDDKGKGSSALDRYKLQCLEKYHLLVKDEVEERPLALYLSKNIK